MKVSQFLTFLNAKLKLPLNFNLAVENNFIFQSWEEEAVLFSWNCLFSLNCLVQPKTALFSHRATLFSLELHFSTRSRPFQSGDALFSPELHTLFSLEQPFSAQSYVHFSA